jgi:hypothetical protein
VRAGDILTTAAGIVEGSRQQTHGQKERSFNTIASFWNTYLRARGISTCRLLEGFDVAQMMALLKMARSIEGDATHVDHFLDGAAYVALAGELSAGNAE